MAGAINAQIIFVRIKRYRSLSMHRCFQEYDIPAEPELKIKNLENYFRKAQAVRGAIEIKRTRCAFTFASQSQETNRSSHHLFNRQNENRARAEFFQFFKRVPENAFAADGVYGDLFPISGKFKHGWGVSARQEFRDGGNSGTRRVHHDVFRLSRGHDAIDAFQQRVENRLFFKREG